MNECKAKVSEFYRLLCLKLEVQNDKDILKPLLDEKSFIRLCGDMGVLPKQEDDGDDEPSEFAGEFDQELIQYLKKAQDGKDQKKKMKLVSVFGKQPQVQEYLKNLGVWKKAWALKASDQGVYCVRVVADDQEVKLLAFSWISDIQFKHDRLRDTATYVLRFLTSLSKNLVCCLSQNDLDEINSVLGSEVDEKWDSYSMSLHVQKCDADTDKVKVSAAEPVVSIESFSGCTEKFLVKGAIPAIASVVKCPEKTVEKECRRNLGKKAFIDEFTKLFKSSNLTWSKLPQVLHQPILEAIGKWPQEALDAFDTDCNIRREEAAVKAAEDTLNELDLWHQKAIKLSEYLFKCEKDEQTKEANRKFQELPKDFNKDSRFKQVSKEWKYKFNLPLTRYEFMKHFKKLYDTYNDARIHEDMQLFIMGGQVNRDIEDDRSFLSRSISKFSTFLDRPNFEEAMKEPLSLLKSKWLEYMEEFIHKVLGPILQDSKEKDCIELRNNEISYDTTRNEIITSALKSATQSNTFGSLKKRITGIFISKAYGGEERVRFNLKEEYRLPVDFEVHIEALEISGYEYNKRRILGSYLLKVGENLKKVYALSSRSIIAISTLGGKTLVTTVQFSSGAAVYAYNNSLKNSTKTVIKEFKRKLNLCDFNQASRTIAFAYSGSNDNNESAVVVYQFNENFSRMETIKQVDLTIKSTLEKPLSDMLLIDTQKNSAVLLVSHNGSAQSINFRSSQASKKMQLIENKERKSQVYSMFHGLCFVSLLPLSMVKGSTHLDVSVFASEGHRKLATVSILLDSFDSKHTTMCCVGDSIYALDKSSNKCTRIPITINMKSDSFKIRKTEQHDIDSTKDHRNLWLWSFFHLYEKFPVRGVLMNQPEAEDFDRFALRLHINSPQQDNVAESLSCYFERVMDALHGLNKPLHSLDMVNNIYLTSSSKNAIQELLQISPSVLETDFIREVIGFIPIQICRAEDNKLLIMTNGEETLSSDEVHGDLNSAVSIAQSLRFGLFTVLLRSWKKKVVVLTSMGKQSTGKSYFLNHLTGASFAISGARCTDGAWMSCRIVGDQMVVIMDFEGLGSFERSEQEDVFLSVLNASISGFTVFRIEMRYDKDIDDLFRKFQNGSQLLKGDKRLFQGKLYMSVKDVNPSDKKSVLGEFCSKVDSMLNLNKDSNFLSVMYRGQIDLNCSPPLGTLGYYRSLGNARRNLQQLWSKEFGYDTGESFLDILSLVLAKLSILDWTDMDESSAKLRVASVKRKLPGIIRFGTIVPLEYVSISEAKVPTSVMESLESKSGSCITGSLNELAQKYPDLDQEWRKLDENLLALSDEEIDLRFDCMESPDRMAKLLPKILNNLFTHYMEIIGIPALDSKQKAKCYSGFDFFLSFIVRRRVLRVTKWATEQLGNSSLNEANNIQQILSTVQSSILRCKSSCSECQLGCLLQNGHASNHCCQTSHKCSSECSYCVNEIDNLDVSKCENVAGHEGPCECSGKDHTCGQECRHKNSPNCGQTCSLLSGHSGLHECGVTSHSCGVACSAFDCSGTCMIDIEHEHSVHKCVEVRCIRNCMMPGCGNPCSCPNHFHGDEKLTERYLFENALPPVMDGGNNSMSNDTHMCSNEHQCSHECAAEGICHMDVHMKRSDRDFTGKRSTFKYTYQEMNGSRLKCCIMLPPGVTEHRESHAHSSDENVIHYCDHRCPCCQYFCTKPYGHDGLHSASHGNMRNTHFVSKDSNNIDFEDRKYAAGEAGIAEMCNLFCTKLGRGHVHFRQCEKENSSECIYSGLADRRRHCTEILEPEPEQPMDEVLHDEYWNSTGWEDPCSATDRQVFGKCPYKCDAEDHENENAESYCVLDVWHSPEPPSNASDGFSYIGGHKFECSHVAESGKIHHIFVLDSSGSMSGYPWTSLMGGVREYVENRGRMNAQCSDLVSVVTFDSDARIVMEATPIAEVDPKSIQHYGGGTSFDHGLRSALEVLSRNDFEAYSPSILFFSDGEPQSNSNGESLATHIFENFSKYGLKAFVVGYGTFNKAQLTRVAENMGGKLHSALTGTELEQTFHTISASLGTRAGLVVQEEKAVRLECPICLEELNHHEEEVKKLTCGHDLHSSCLGNALTNCPLCRAEI